MKKLFILFGLVTMTLVAMFSSCGKGSDGPDDPENPEKPNNPTGGVKINGVVWATRNVGEPGKFVDKPEDAGMFYQWGKNVGWSSTDPLVSSSGDTTWDGSTVSGNVWASFNDPCPKGWRVPTLGEFTSLLNGNEVISVWEKHGEVNGRAFFDANTEKSVFLPASGYRYDNGSLSGVDSSGNYWSSTVNYSGYADYLNFGSGEANTNNDYRAYGHSVRCVAQ